MKKEQKEIRDEIIRLAYAYITQNVHILAIIFDLSDNQIRNIVCDNNGLSTAKA